MGTSGRIVQINVSAGRGAQVPHSRGQNYCGRGGRRSSEQSQIPRGGSDRAVCLWSLEVIETLQAEGHPIAPGSAGENLTLAGIDWAALVPGCQLQLGSGVQIEITDYAAPCRQNMKWFSDRKFSRISQKHYPGSSRLYARVLTEGKVQPGDPVQVIKT